MLKMYKNRAIKAMSDEVVSDETGSIIAIVTTIRDIYPIENAKVTIFKGDIDNKEIVEVVYTDESGRTRQINLKTPSKSLSEKPGAEGAVYSVYNMLVSADGYVDNIHLNIPVFSGVTSLQKANLISLATAGENAKPQIFDESENYDL